MVKNDVEVIVPREVRAIWRVECSSSDRGTLNRITGAKLVRRGMASGSPRKRGRAPDQARDGSTPAEAADRQKRGGGGAQPWASENKAQKETGCLLRGGC